MADKVTPQQERLRREMVGDGLDPTDPEQRKWYENTMRGAVLNLDESIQQFKRSLSPALQWALNRLAKPKKSTEDAPTTGEPA